MVAGSPSGKRDLWGCCWWGSAALPAATATEQPLGLLPCPHCKNRPAGPIFCLSNIAIHTMARLGMSGCSQSLGWEAGGQPELLDGICTAAVTWPHHSMLLGSRL